MYLPWGVKFLSQSKTICFHESNHRSLIFATANRRRLLNNRRGDVLTFFFTRKSPSLLSFAFIANSSTVGRFFRVHWSIMEACASTKNEAAIEAGWFDMHAVEHAAHDSAID